MINFFAHRPYLIALFISAILTLWLLSAQWAVPDSTEQEKPVSPHAQPITKVSVRNQYAQSITRNVVLTGRTAPSRTAVLRAEIDGQVVDTPIEPGRPVKQETVLARLAVDDKTLRLKEAETLVQQRELEYQAQLSLARKGYQEKLKTSETLTLLESAKLLAEQTRIALDNTEIRAPFDGIFVDRLIEVGDYVMMGDTIAIVSDDDPGLVVADVTELERNNLRIGGKATAHLVTGKIITGQIRFISVTADPVTHTFEVEVEAPNPQRDMPAGVTAELHIPVETILAHEVSAALLSLNDEGILGVKAVNAKNQVVFYPAQLADATTKGIWLTGLPNQLQFITVGQGFVRAGDTVQPVAER